MLLKKLFTSFLIFTAFITFAQDKSYFKNINSNTEKGQVKLLDKNDNYWGLAVGSNVIMPTGKLNNYFPSHNNFYFSLDLSIKNIYASLYLSVGSPNIKRSFFNIENDTKKDFFIIHEKFSYFEGGLNGGYYLIDDGTFRIAPFITLASATLESNRFKPDMNNFEFNVFKSFIAGPGIHGETELFSFNRNNKFERYNYKHSFILKMDVGYNQIFNQKIKRFKGNQFYIRLALVWGIKNFF